MTSNSRLRKWTTLLRRPVLQLSKGLIVLLALFLLGCALIPLSAGAGDWAQSTLNKLTLREKIAQMMVDRMNMRFINNESERWADIQKMLENDGVGAIHLFYGEAGNALTMMNEMQTISRVPILFTGDIERGIGQRYPGGTHLPPLMAIAASGDPANAYEAGRIAGLESRAVGIQINWSPIVDVNNNPANPIINVRAFGDNTELVTAFGKAFVDGLHASNMAATIKHFPGHGDTQTDTHSSLATIPSDSTRLWDLELAPFAALIEHGVDAVMIAHVRAPDYQPEADQPSTLSRFWIIDILRNRLGFEGIVVTDAMDMGGITENYSDAFALVATINAGSDLIIQNNDVGYSIDIVERAVNDGLIDEARIDEAVYRILLLKEKLGLHTNRYLNYDHTMSALGSSASRESAARIASEGITLVKNEGGLVPLRYTTAQDTIFCIDLYDAEHRHRLSTASEMLMRSGLPVKPLALDLSDPEEWYAFISDIIPEHARIVVNVFAAVAVQKDRIFLTDIQTGFIRRISQRSNKIIVISHGNPYLIQAFPEIPAYMISYKGTAQMQTAATQALLGYSAIQGRLPISIPGVAAYGTGISMPADSLIVPAIMDTSVTRLRRVLPGEAGADITALQQLLAQSVADSAWPGGVLLAARDGQIFVHEAFGYHSIAGREKTHRSDIFDLASLTKVLATTLGYMQLYAADPTILDAPAMQYLPEFGAEPSDQRNMKRLVTIRQLLTHTSGLPAGAAYWKIGASLEDRLAAVYATPLDTLPGARYLYSDTGFILLGKILESITGLSLATYLDSMVYQPLQLETTGFNPSGERISRIVPTEIGADTDEAIRGYVHDENAHSLGGVAGHAGLFSSARDLAVLAQTLLNGGRYGDIRVFDSAAVELFTSRANIIEGSSRCLGWDQPAGEASAGVYASSSSFGHTGFTGTSFWVDPDNNLFVILLTNAVHPTRAAKTPKYYDWRQRIHSAVYESLPDHTRNPDLILKKRWQHE